MKGTAVAAAAAWAALAVSPALALETGASLYGDVRLSLGYFDSDATGDDTDVDDNRSYAGLRLTAREGGIAAFVQYERLLDEDDTEGDANRQFFGGVTGQYGTLSYGRQATAYKLAGQKLDPFYNLSVAGTSGAPGMINGASYGQSELGNDTVGSGFVDNQIAYVSPLVSGLRVNAAVFLDDAGGDAEEHDYAAGIEFAQGGLTLGVQALDLQSGSAAGSRQNFSDIGLAGAAAELNALRYYAALARDRWGVGASYETLDLKAGLPDRAYAYAAGWYGLSDRLRVALGYGDTRDTPFEGRGYMLGASYTLIENLNVYVAGRHVERDDRAEQGSDTQVYALGVSYTFDIALK